MEDESEPILEKADKAGVLSYGFEWKMRENDGFEV